MQNSQMWLWVMLLKTKNGQWIECSFSISMVTDFWGDRLTCSFSIP